MLGSISRNLFRSAKAKCSDNQEFDLDDPNFARSISYDDIERQQNNASMKHSRRPPSFDTFMNSIRTISRNLELIKGFRFEVGLAPSQRFYMAHSWNIMNTQTTSRKGRPTGYYLFMGQYLGEGFDPRGKESPSFIMTGRADSGGKLEAALIKHLNQNLALRWTVGYPNDDIEYAQTHLDLDYEGQDFTSTFKWGTGLWGMNFMQTIGTKLVFYAARYSFKRHSFYAIHQARTHETSFAYMQRVSSNAQLVSEFRVKTGERTETAVILGLRQRFSKTELVVNYNSKGKVVSIINVLGALYNIKLCASANYKRDRYKFGYGVSLGQI